MQRPVLILGGYGNFGKRIARALIRDNISIIIAGRNATKAKAFSDELAKDLASPKTLTPPKSLVSIATFDVNKDLEAQIQRLQPAVVINTCGPFQNSDYRVAQACIEKSVPYIDLADGRDFVTGIRTLNDAAKAKGVAVISGASTVPGLSSAVVEHFKDQFSAIDDMTYGITPGQKADVGLATTEGILSYVGKKLKSVTGAKKNRYGWQDIYRQTYPVLGKRWMANCDVPDLDLFPTHYGIKSIRFSAGMEVGAVHLGVWALSWLVRCGLPLDLKKLAAPLLTLRNWFHFLGSGDGGMHVILTGRDHEGQPLTKKWFILGLDGDGPQIPTIPAIILAKKIARGEINLKGAMPCVGLVTLEEYIEELTPFSIQTHQE